MRLAIESGIALEIVFGCEYEYEYEYEQEQRMGIVTGVRSCQHDRPLDKPAGFRA